MNREPWFVDSLQPADGVVWQKVMKVWNQSHRHTQKHNFFINSFDIVENNINGDYHEFGCRKARTFRMALLEAKRHFLDDMSFYALTASDALLKSTEHHNNTRWTPGSLATSQEDFPH